MQEIINTILTNWPYVLFATFFAVFCISVVIYQTKDRMIKKRKTKLNIEKSKNFKKYNVTEVDVKTLSEKRDFK